MTTLTETMVRPSWDFIDTELPKTFTLTEYYRTDITSIHKQLDILANQNKNDNKYQHNTTPTKTELKVCYEFKNEKKYGRYYPDKQNLTTAYSKLRNTIINREKTWDIDMKNSMPTIMSQLLTQENIKCPMLDFYVENRDEIFKIYDIERSLIKEYFTAIIMGGNSVPKEVREFEIEFENDDGTEEVFSIDKLQKEINLIKKKIQNCDNQTIKNLIKFVQDKSGKRGGKLLSSVIAYIYQTIESIIIYNCIQYIQQLGLYVSTYIYDGFHIISDEKPEVCEKLNELVREKFGFNIKFTIKGFDEYFSNEDISKVQLPTTKIDFMAHNDETECAEYFMRMFPNYVFNTQGTMYCYDINTGFYNEGVCAELTIQKLMRNFRDDFMLPPKRGEDEPSVSYADFTHTRSKVLKSLEFLSFNPQRFQELQDTARNYLLFKNGIFNMKTRKMEDFNPNIYFEKSTNQEYTPLTDSEIEAIDNYQNAEIKELPDSLLERYSWIKLIYRSFIYNMLIPASTGKNSDEFQQDVCTYWCRLMAQVIAGMTCRRNFIWYIGGTGCGKSMIAEALGVCFGGFVGKFSGDLLLTNDSSTDPAAQNRPFLLSSNKRILFGSEITTTTQRGAERMVNGNRLKSLSGGEGLEGRKHRENETIFHPQFTCAMASNDIPKIAPCGEAVRIRLKMINTPNNFVRNPDKSKNERLADDKLNTIKNDYKTMRAFYDILLCMVPYMYEKEFGHSLFCDEAVIQEPPIYQQLKDKWTADDCGTETIDEIFIFTGNDEDAIPKSEIAKVITLAKIKGLTRTKFKQELEKRGAVDAKDCKRKFSADIIENPLFPRPIDRQQGAQRYFKCVRYRQADDDV